MYTKITSSAEETESFGRLIGKNLFDKHFFIALYGDLGAGKTAFVRGLADILSPGSKVKSPTYTIVNEYRKGKTPLFHFDLYRIESEDELDGFGFEEYLINGNCVTEWSEHIGSMLPKNAVKISIEKLTDTERKITVDGLDVQE